MVPKPTPGLTSKNKTALRQFDDPAVLRRLYDFSNRLWAEVKRQDQPNGQTLVKAQVAISVAILCCMPIRLQNLAALTFDKHLFLKAGPGAISSLELAAAEVKNKVELAFDIPRPLAKMLIDYRNRIAPKVIGRRPDQLFIRADGVPKNQWTVAWAIRKYLKRRTGIALSPHQFRHLSVKVILDREPGNFETPRQLLGHKSVGTTASIYAGISTRRAARHHQQLVEEALTAQIPKRQNQSPRKQGPIGRHVL
jgi:integrase